MPDWKMLHKCYVWVSENIDVEPVPGDIWFGIILSPELTVKP